MTARKHHYLTQCYLKGFASDRKKPKLFVVDLPRRTSFRTAPSNIGAIRDFNRIDLQGHAIDRLEKDYAKFESAVGPALVRSAITRSIAEGEDHELILQLLTLVAVRNPRLRGVQNKGISDVATMMLDLILESEERYNEHLAHMQRVGIIKEGEQRLSYAAVKETVSKGNLKFELSQMWMIGAELFSLEKLLPIIRARSWTRIVALPDSEGFVTSDHPVSLMWSDPKLRGGFYSPGFAMGGTEVVFPVSKELALLGTFEGLDSEIKATEELEAAVNGATIVNAARQIYAGSDRFVYNFQPKDEIKHGTQLLKDKTFLRARKAGFKE
jgi:hypothetical protein